MDLGIDGIEDATPLGSGGFGTVYRARQVRLHRTVAVKILPRTGGDDTAELRFQREAAALGTLATHPNIVTVYDSGLTANGEPYLIMELVSRGSLADQVASEGPMAWARVLEVGVGLSGALASAHAAGILHRDIKPANVLVSDFDEPMLADFGIARMEGAGQTQSAAITGSAAHLAPELLHGEPPSEASDVYALGSTLFHLLAGTPAFVRSTDQTVAAAYQRILTAPVPDLRPQGVPDEVCALLERLLDKEPAQRPSSAQEVGEALRDLQRRAGLDPTPLLVKRVDAGEVAAAMAAADAPTSTVDRTADSVGPPVDATADAPVDRVPSKLHDTGTDAEGRPPVPTPTTTRRGIIVGGAVASLVVAGVAVALLGDSAGEGSPADGTTAGKDTVAASSGTTDPTGDPGEGAATGASSGTAAALTATSGTAAGSTCNAFASPGEQGGDGSAAAPFGTVAELLATLAPGEVGCLAQGTWTEDVVIDESLSGTPAAPVTIGGVRGHEVVLTGSWTVTAQATDVAIESVAFVGASTSAPLSVNGHSVRLDYLEMTNPNGPCLEVTAPSVDRDRQSFLSVSVLRDCGSLEDPASAAAIVVGANASFGANNFVIDGASATGIVVQGADFLALTGVTMIGHASPVVVAFGAGGTDPVRAVSVTGLLATDVVTPPVVALEGQDAPGFFLVDGTCVALGPTSADRVQFSPDDFPVGSTLGEVQVAQSPVAFVDRGAGNYALDRGSGCTGAGTRITELLPGQG